MTAHRTNRLRGALAAVVAVAVGGGWVGERRALAVPPERGDANSDGTISITDAIFTLNFLFLGGERPKCEPIADTDALGGLNITDGVFLLGHLFLGGSAPPPLSEADLALCRVLDPAQVARGRTVYETPDAGGNAFSCSNCHASVPDEESPVIHVASSLHDAICRPSYKLGQLETFLEAANTCRVHWMETTAWVEADPGHQDLAAFLTSLAPLGIAPTVDYEIAQPAIQGDATGDADLGCELYHRTCVACHGPEAAGTHLAPSLVELPIRADFIRALARLGGPTGSIYEGLLGGLMPFWSRDRLSDLELEDIVTYLTTRPLPECALPQ
jgi:mono/diheme cytochrome c family protein